MRIEGKLVVA